MQVVTESNVSSNNKKRSQISTTTTTTTKKVKVSSSSKNSSELSTNNCYFVTYVHYDDNEEAADMKDKLTELNFKHIIQLVVNSMYGMIGESLYPYKVISYNQQKHIGIIEITVEKEKQTKLRSALTMYSGPYLKMPIRIDVIEKTNVLK